MEENQGEIMNLVDAQARDARYALLSIARENPGRILDTARNLSLPARHPVRARDMALKGWVLIPDPTYSSATGCNEAETFPLTLTEELIKLRQKVCCKLDGLDRC